MEEIKTQIVILHGTEGSPEKGWFPSLARGFNHVEVHVPRLPTPEGQSLENWRAAYQEQVGELTPGTILVGHSIGATFALRLVESSQTPITGIFLAAGVTKPIGHKEYDPLLASFINHPFDWERIRKQSSSQAGGGFVYHGSEDKFVPLSQGKEIAKGLGVELTIVKGAGHFSGDEGFTTFPQLYDDLANFVDRVD